MMISLSYFVLNVFFSTHLLFVVTFLGWDFVRYSGDSFSLRFLICCFFFNSIFFFSSCSFCVSFFFSCSSFFLSCSFLFLSCSSVFSDAFFNVIRPFFKHFCYIVLILLLLLLYYPILLKNPYFIVSIIFLTNLIIPIGEKPL